MINRGTSVKGIRFGRGGADFHEYDLLIFEAEVLYVRKLSIFYLLAQEHIAILTRFKCDYSKHILLVEVHVM